MHFSTLSVQLLAFSITLTSARFYPRSDIDLAENDYEDDEYDIEDHHFYSPPQQALYEFSYNQPGQDHQYHQQQEHQSIQTRPHQIPAQRQSTIDTTPQRLLTRTNAAYYASKGIGSAGQCKKVADCKCPNPKVTNACMNGKCSCGNAELGKIGNAFAKPILEGVKKIGDGLEKVVNDTAWALKAALKIGSWFIPGVGKTAAKVLSAAIPETKLKTGNVKADEVLNALSKVI